MTAQQSQPTSATRREANCGRIFVELAGAIVMALIAAIWLRSVNPSPRPSFDPQLASVVDCMGSGRCDTMGLTSVNSTMVLFEGAVWQDFLIFVRFVGGGPSLALMLIIALTAVGVGLIYLATARLFHPAAAMAASIFAVALLSTSPYATQFIDTSLLFFLSTMTALSLCLFGLSGRLGILAIAAAFTALAFGDHVSAVCLIPALLVVACMAGRSPLSATAVAAGAFLCATYVTSAHALAENAQSVKEAAWSLGAGLVICFVVGIGLRSAYAQRDQTIKGAFIAAILLMPWGIGLLALVVRQRHLDARYLQAIIAPAAITCAVVSARLVGRGAPSFWKSFLVSTGLSLGCFVRLAWPMFAHVEPLQRYGWTSEDGARIGTWLGQRGWTYSSLYERLQGPRCRDLLLGMAPFAPVGPESEDRRQVRVWSAESRADASLPENAVTIALEGNRVAVVSPIDSWIDTAGSVRCRGALTEGAEPVCWNPTAIDDQSPQPWRADRVVQEMMLSWVADPAPEQLTYFVLLRPGAGQFRDFAIADSIDSLCTQIIAVEGVEADRPLPARRVRVYSRDGAPARLAVRSVLKTPECLSRDERLPCLLESMPEETDAFRSVVEGGVGDGEGSRLPQVTAALTSDPWPKSFAPTAAALDPDWFGHEPGWVSRQRMIGGVVVLVGCVAVGLPSVVIALLRRGAPARRLFRRRG